MTVYDGKTAHECVLLHDHADVCKNICGGNNGEESETQAAIVTHAAHDVPPADDGDAGWHHADAERHGLIVGQPTWVGKL